MSVLDRNFLQDLTTLPPTLTNHSDYMTYLQTDVKGILDAELLSHIIEGGGSDTTTFLYRYEDKYIYKSSIIN
jgi:hypothetical protein